jgi:hypothetical protein
MMLLIAEWKSENENHVDQRENVGLECNRDQQGQHNERLNQENHALRETYFVFHHNTAFDDLLQLIDFVIL